MPLICKLFDLITTTTKVGSCPVYICFKMHKQQQQQLKLCWWRSRACGVEFKNHQCRFIYVYRIIVTYVQD